MSVGFSIGPFFIHYYGVIIMGGALLAAWVADREAKRRGLNNEMIWDCLPWLLIGGIIGARLWHILTPPASMVAQGITLKYYILHPLDAIAVWRGGVGIPGAVMGGTLALFIYTRNKRQNFATWVDIIAPGLAIAQAIGRWGNFVNQELYGAPSNLPWAIVIDPEHRLPGFEKISYYHPLFLYESIFNLLNAGILFWMGRKFADRLKPGEIFLTYMIIYPTGRFFLEFLRLDPSPVAGLNVNQVLMAVIALGSIGYVLWRHRTGSKSIEELKEEDQKN